MVSEGRQLLKNFRSYSIKGLLRKNARVCSTKIPANDDDNPLNGHYQSPLSSTPIQLLTVGQFTLLHRFFPVRKTCEGGPHTRKV